MSEDIKSSIDDIYARARARQTSSEVVWEKARRMAKYGRRDWIVWKNIKGEWFTEPAGIDAMKRARVDVGEDGSYTLVDRTTAICFKVSKGIEHTMIANMEAGHYTYR